MSELPAWKRALQEPNALGWIGLFLLVIAIGTVTLWHGGDKSRQAGPPAGMVQNHR